MTNPSENQRQAEWDEVLHGTNPAIIWGTRRIEWKDILDQGFFAAKFNAMFDLLARRESAAAYAGAESVVKAVEGAYDAWLESSDVQTSNLVECAKLAADNLKPKEV